MVLLLCTCTAPTPCSTLPPATIQHCMGAAIHKIRKFKRAPCPKIVSPCISSGSSHLYWSWHLFHKCQGNSPEFKNCQKHTNTLYYHTHNSPSVTCTSTPPPPQSVPYTAKCLRRSANKVMACKHPRDYDWVQFVTS